MFYYELRNINDNELKIKMKERERVRVKKLQAGNMTVGITYDMEPGAGIDKSWVPTLQRIGWIRKPTS